LYSWIGARGSLFRRELPLFVYLLWERGKFAGALGINEPWESKGPEPLMTRSALTQLRKKCEEIYLDIRITRFQALLEGFSPEDYLNIYMVDSLSGYDFEIFLTKLFSCLGYEVEETRKSKDQGADLFVRRFNKTTVIQAKNYIDNVGNSAVQQALAAKAFYDCDEAMVVTNSYFTPSAKELAMATNVRLVDRDELIGYIDEYNQAIIEQQGYGQPTESNQVDQPSASPEAVADR
jgi:hypothetical protein